MNLERKILVPPQYIRLKEEFESGDIGEFFLNSREREMLGFVRHLSSVGVFSEECDFNDEQARSQRSEFEIWERNKYGIPSDSDCEDMIKRMTFLRSEVEVKMIRDEQVKNVSVNENRQQGLFRCIDIKGGLLGFILLSSDNFIGTLLIVNRRVIPDKTGDASYTESKIVISNTGKFAIIKKTYNSQMPAGKEQRYYMPLDVFHRAIDNRVFEEVDEAEKLTNLYLMGK